MFHILLSCNSQRSMECTYVRTYICMYVCMHVRMYVRTYVCMHVCTYVRTYICMCVCTYVRRYVCMYVGMYVCTYVRMYVYMYVCMYLLLLLLLLLLLNRPHMLPIFFDPCILFSTESYIANSSNQVRCMSLMGILCLILFPSLCCLLPE
jgi:hypothetical protein